jgi:hypothetical protein
MPLSMYNALKYLKLTTIRERIKGEFCDKTCFFIPLHFKRRSR